MPSHTQKWQDLNYTSRDGLRLHARLYPAPGARRRPLVCLPGLTRNARDFHDLAHVLADPRGHRRSVLAVDYRGRGQSEHAPDFKTYSILTELGDVLDAMAIAGIHDAAILGTSRGGLIAMAMAALRPTAIGAVILNDIGPVIERDGLARIVAYVGRIPLPGTWAEATQLVKSLNARAFPTQTDDTWANLARQTFNEVEGRPAPGYDANLANAVALANGPVPDLWRQFAALTPYPTMVLRGANSDILSAATLAEMQRRHPQLDAITVPDQGHAPLLNDADTIGAIYQFLLSTDRRYDLEAEPARARPA